jgi:hypothetical protein
MIEIEINTHKIRLFASAEELPIGRYSRFQKYNLIESGVGATTEAIGSHFSNLFTLLSHNMAQDALTEAKNLYYSFYMMLEEISVPGMAFSCLIHSIDNEPFTDTSEDSLKATVTRLSDYGLTQATVTHWIDLIKKKSTMS